MMAVFVPAWHGERNVFQHHLVAEGERNIVHAHVTAQIGDDLAGFLLFGSIQDGADPHVRGGCLRDDVAHESDENDGEDQDRKVRIEGREIAQTHAAGDHEMAAQQQDDDGRDIGGERDGRDQAGEQAQNAQPEVSRLGVGRQEFLVFDLLRVEQPDQRGAQNAFVDHAVQPVDRLPAPS